MRWSPRGPDPRLGSCGSVDQPVQQLEGRVRLVDVAEMALVADDLGPAEPVEHGAALTVVAPVRILAGVDEVQVADAGPDRRPVVGVLQYGLVRGAGPGAVPGHEDG